MKIEIFCDDNPTFATRVVLHSLDFEPEAKTFSMRVPMGDDWLGQKVRCPVDAAPVSVHLEQGLTRIHFEHYKDAAAFGAWLIESDSQVKRGFRTMRG